MWLQGTKIPSLPQPQVVPVSPGRDSPHLQSLPALPGSLGRAGGVSANGPTISINAFQPGSWGSCSASGEELGPDLAAQKEGVTIAVPCPRDWWDIQADMVGGHGEHWGNKAGPSWPCGHTYSWGGDLQSSLGEGTSQTLLLPHLRTEHPGPWAGVAREVPPLTCHLYGLTCGPTLLHIMSELTCSVNTSQPFAQWGN